MKLSLMDCGESRRLRSESFVGAACSAKGQARTGVEVGSSPSDRSIASIIPCPLRFGRSCGLAVIRRRASASPLIERNLARFSLQCITFDIAAPPSNLKRDVGTLGSCLTRSALKPKGKSGNESTEGITEYILRTSRVDSYRAIPGIAQFQRSPLSKGRESSSSREQKRGCETQWLQRTSGFFMALSIPKQSPIRGGNGHEGNS